MTPQATPLHPSHFHPVLLEILQHLQIDREKLEFCEDTGKRAEELGWEDTQSNVGKVGLDADRMPRILLQDPILSRDADSALRWSLITESQKAYLSPGREQGRLFIIHLLLHEIAHWKLGHLSSENLGTGGNASSSPESSDELWIARRAKEIQVDDWAIEEMQRLAFLPANLPECPEDS